MPSVTVKKKRGGKLAVGFELKRIVENDMGPYVHRGGLAMMGGLMRATPRVSGHLQRGWNASRPGWMGSRLLSRAGNRVIYVRRVDRLSRLNRGFIRRGRDAGKAPALDQLKAGARHIGKALWRPD